MSVRDDSAAQVVHPYELSYNDCKAIILGDRGDGELVYFSDQAGAPKAAVRSDFLRCLKAAFDARAFHDLVETETGNLETAKGVLRTRPLANDQP